MSCVVFAEISHFDHGRIEGRGREGKGDPPTLNILEKVFRTRKTSSRMYRSIAVIAPHEGSSSRFKCFQLLPLACRARKEYEVQGRLVGALSVSVS